MGYTNYFYVKKGLDELPKKFVEDASKVVNEWNRIHQGSGLLLKSHSKSLWLEGEPVTHEGFRIDIDPDPKYTLDTEFGFFDCTKTRRDPYDSAVKAICMLGVHDGAEGIRHVPACLKEAKACTQP